MLQQVLCNACCECNCCFAKQNLSPWIFARVLHPSHAKSPVLMWWLWRAILLRFDCSFKILLSWLFSTCYIAISHFVKFSVYMFVNFWQVFACAWSPDGSLLASGCVFWSYFLRIFYKEFFHLDVLFYQLMS